MQGFNNQTARPMNPNQAGYNMSMQTNSTPHAIYSYLMMQQLPSKLQRQQLR